MTKKEREKWRQSQHKEEHPPVTVNVQEFFVGNAGNRLE
jgi:hypothetical protein